MYFTKGISQNSQENNCIGVSYFWWSSRPEPCNFMRLRHRFFPINFAKFLRASSDNCCYLWKELKIAYIAESCTISRGLKYNSIVKKRLLLTKFSTMIVKINAFSEDSYEVLLSYTSFFLSDVSVAVVTWKSKTPLLTKFTVMKLKIYVFSVSMIFL